MTDATGTDAGHPALLTATGPAAPPTPGDDPTGTPAGHPAIVTRLPYVPPAAAAKPKPSAPRKPRRKKKKHRHRTAAGPRFTG